jgi:lysophospholipase L1-like esterase
MNLRSVILLWAAAGPAYSPANEAASAFEAQTSSWHFRFNPSSESDGGILVLPAHRYSAARGFGYETQVSEASSGAQSVKPDPSESQSWSFSVKLPEGTYRVFVSLEAPDVASAITIKAETRRLMVESATTRPGSQSEHQFLVNIRTDRIAPPPTNAPGGHHVVLNHREIGSLTWDEKLTLEFSGTNPRVRNLRIEPERDAPTIFLIGDSTVTDQPREPSASWGQMLPRFLNAEIAVANHAESGETLKSFMTGLRLAKVLECLRSGDYLLVQFGHNDQKTQWPQTYSDPKYTYPAYLKVVIAEARRKGATPILVTSMHRQRLDDAGHVIESLGGYPEAMRRVCQEENVACIDLHALSKRIYEALGPARLSAAFVDGTHHSNYGAYVLAAAVADSLRRVDARLATLMSTSSAAFDPEHPPDPGR